MKPMTMKGYQRKNIKKDGKSLLMKFNYNLYFTTPVGEILTVKMDLFTLNHIDSDRDD